VTQIADGIFYTVRRSDRARRVRVTVEATRGVEVVLPRRAAERDAAAAVRQLRPWIERRLRAVGEQRAAVAARGDTVPYLGTTLQLAPEAGRSRVVQRDRTLLTPVGAARTEALERWYRRMARPEIAPRVDRAAAQLGSRYTTLSIRGQRTRWGSCSTNGALSFNWRLLLAPEPVLDYVIWHEVCHLRALDHSPRFWSLVAANCPDHREQAAWLRRHGGTLVL
jgi:predicted metal-dependent hydrolase